MIFVRLPLLTPSPQAVTFFEKIASLNIWTLLTLALFIFVSVSFVRSVITGCWLGINQNRLDLDQFLLGFLFLLNYGIVVWLFPQ